MARNREERLEVAAVEEVACKTTVPRQDVYRKNSSLITITAARNTVQWKPITGSQWRRNGVRGMRGRGGGIVPCKDK